jgi:hypothetical protein
MERFCDESVEQWFSDLAWAWNDEKVRALLQDIFYRRLRLSHIQARLWKRTIDLFWRAGWSLRQIGDQFGVDRRNVWRIVNGLRREAQRFFGQEVQPHEGQQPQPKEKAKPTPIAADAKNDSPEYWEAVLASYGLSDPDVQVGTHAGGPVYKFAWWSGTSVHAESWAEFYAGQSQPKPRFQSLSKSHKQCPGWQLRCPCHQLKQIGTKTIEIEGQNYEVKICEPARASTYRWWPNPKQKQAGPDREYDPEQISGILAHIPTAKDVEDADSPTEEQVRMDGGQEARQFLYQYRQIHDNKTPSIVPWRDPSSAWRPQIKKSPLPTKKFKSFFEHDSKEHFTLQRRDIVQFIRDREIVKQHLAAIANVPAARLSDYLHDKSVSEEYAERIAEAVQNIILVWKTFAPIRIALDDPAAFAKAVELANQVHTKLAEERTELLRDLPVDFDLGTASGTAA